MGAPLGNDNANKGKIFRAAMDKAIRNKASKTDQFKILVDMSEKMLEMGAGGDLQAIKEVRDTLDGKPSQQVQLADSDGGKLTINLIQYQESK